MDKPRWTEVTDPREAEQLIYGAAGLDFPHVSVAGDGRVWADAEELRAWRSQHTSSCAQSETGAEHD